MLSIPCSESALRLRLFSFVLFLDCSVSRLYQVRSGQVKSSHPSQVVSRQAHSSKAVVGAVGSINKVWYGTVRLARKETPSAGTTVNAPVLAQEEYSARRVYIEKGESVQSPLPSRAPQTALLPLKKRSQIHRYTDR